MAAKNFVPPFLVKRWRDLIRFGDLEMNADVFSGMILFYSCLLSVAAFFVALALKLPLLQVLGAFVVVPVFFLVISDMVIRIIADSRARICEESFPDVLILMSSNIKAGLTPDRALQYSIRSEFGPLALELQHAARRASTGLDFGRVLMEVTHRIKSTLIEGSIRLIVEGMVGGGELSSLLEETAHDIKNMELIRSEVRAQIRTYSVFIFFAAVIGAPVLFSVSLYLVNMLKIINPIDVTTLPREAVRNLPFMTMKPPSYGTEFLMLYVMANMVVISVFAGLLIGLIEQGNELRGAQYIPLLLSLSIGIFYFTNFVVQNLSGTVIGMGR
jgi:archaellum biogenesis protein FlaJ (TadC family)